MANSINRKFIGGGEGFAIYTSECNSKFLLILNESTIIGLLSEEDADGISGEKVLEFSSAQERAHYLTTIDYTSISEEES